MIFCLKQNVILLISCVLLDTYKLLTVKKGCNKLAFVYLSLKVIPCEALQGHSCHITCVFYECRNQTIMCGITDSSIKVWDSESGETLRALKGSCSQQFCTSFHFT